MDWKIERVFVPVTDVDRAKAPGTQDSIQVVVPDADAARQHLLDHGVAASDVQDLAWGRFVSFADPDGNTWTLQEVPPRE
ncbi:MAG TPA: hypothetical protein VIQ78_05505 [Terrimesophilobacter sp.]|jgi:hypothetical protein|uniref:VOC family protein n=1 Tax=Terrimesophilobacter sp. TaxID=2906435 RepID=UPI002F93F1B2